MTTIAPLRPMTVLNAEIKTAAVEIRTLTVSGKQVTLAVFRQLKEERLVNRDGSLNGLPWGIVNYHPDKCSDGREHFHVVWQRGTELLRSTVEVSPLEHFGTKTGDAALTLAVYRKLKAGRIPKADETYISTQIDQGDLSLLTGQYADPLTRLAALCLRFGFARVDKNYLKMEFPSFRDLICELDSETYSSLLGRVMQKLEIMCAAYEGAEDRFKQQVIAEFEFRKSYIKSVDTLACLPQLFIAV